MADNIVQLLARVQHYAESWFKSLPARPVRPTVTAAELRNALGGPLPLEGIGAGAVAEALARIGMRGTVASAGPRYFGFVVGGNLPAALAADWLVSAWDQNGGIYALSPLVSVVEQITGCWLLELAGLPATMSFGFVTGCQMANLLA